MLSDVWVMETKTLGPVTVTIIEVEKVTSGMNSCLKACLYIYVNR